MAASDKPSADASAKPPEVPGAKVIVLKEGEKLPKRVDPDYEDWSSPALPPHMKHGAMPLATGSFDGFTREIVQVQWRELDPIDLYVIKPKGMTKPPVILYLYSFPSTNARYKDDKFCEFLTRNGFAAIGFVSALTEDRFHDRPTDQWFVSELQESLATSTHDVQMILNYLERRGDFDMTRVGMWGDGSGASIAIMAAAVDPRIKALDLLDPWGDWPDWLAKSSLVPERERAGYLTPQFLKKVDNLDPLKWLPQVKTQQVRLQYIEQGVTITPDEVKEKMEAAAPGSAKIVQYENTKAFVTEVGAKGTGFDWIKEQLGPSDEKRGTGDQSVTQAAPSNLTSGPNQR
ncbi:MAG: alpha/beta hydrolase [Candidatus Sulfotelmatobacter sp.]